MPEVDAVLVPVGGGSLVTGIAIAVKHLKPDTEVYVSKNCFHVALIKSNDHFVSLSYLGNS